MSGLLIWLILMIGLVSGAQRVQAQGSVSGRVLDANGRAVVNATVMVRGYGVFAVTTTDAAGNWHFSDLLRGSHEFYAAAVGHASWPEPRRITVPAATTVILTLNTTSNALVNGDFENSQPSAYWQQPNGGVNYSNVDVFDGYTAARLGEGRAQEVLCWQNNRLGQLWTLKQSVIIPPVANPGLSFVYKIETSQVMADYAWLEAVLIVNGQPHYLTPWGELWAGRDWTVKSFDLSPWRGQYVDLLFQVAHCSNHSLVATIDRVTIGDIPGASSPNPGSTPTPTPWPTFTPLPSATPTASPTPTPTTSPTPTPTVNPTLTPSPIPGSDDFTVTVRRLTACENRGLHHLFIRIRDANNTPLSDVRVKVRWPDGGEIILTSGDKIEDLGLAEFPMFKGYYWVSLVDFAGPEVGPLTPNIPGQEVCQELDELGNWLYHYSYELVFRQE